MNADVTALRTDPKTRRCPTDFRYWEALERSDVARGRRIARLLLGFDPAPPEHLAWEFIEDMYAGDPVADDFVDEVIHGPDGPRKGRQLLDRALEQGIDNVPEAPESMRRLFAEFERVPDWVDPELVEQGARIWRRWGKTLFDVAGAGTLEMYTESAVAVPLSLAGGYAGDAALNRFLETVHFWLDVAKPGALLTPGRAGRATALRVRVMHVSVRRRVAEHPEWHADRWGLPISQAYMLLTLIGGSVAPALMMWPLGYLTTPSEMRALLHFQRYMGHIVGVFPRWTPTSIRDCIQMLFMTGMGRTYTAGRHGAELIESFPQAFEPGEDSRGLRRVRDVYEHQMIAGYMGMLMAPWTRRRYDVPPAFPGLGLLAARTPFIAATELARRAVPGVDELVTRRARSRAERWYRDRMDGKEAAFDAGRDLRR